MAFADDILQGRGRQQGAHLGYRVVPIYERQQVPRGQLSDYPAPRVI